MRWLNYQHLFYFWSVAKAGSMTEASRRLRLTQPTISVQLKTLEETLGEKLFRRDGRYLRLTETGQLVFNYAEKIFASGQELLDVLDGRTPGSAKEIRIGLSDVVPKTLAYHLIEPAFSPVFDSFVNCIEDHTEVLLAELAAGQIDLVIADRPIPPTTKVKAFNHFVGECGVAFVGSPKLTQRYRKNFPQSLSQAPLLFPTPESALRGELNRWFSDLELAPNCVGAFQDRALMKLAAKAGKGIIPVPIVVEAEVKKEFRLETVGRTNQIKEQVYLISTEKKIRNELVKKIWSEGQKDLFKQR